MVPQGLNLNIVMWDLHPLLPKPIKMDFKNLGLMRWIMEGIRTMIMGLCVDVAFFLTALKYFIMIL